MKTTTIGILILIFLIPSISFSQKTDIVLGEKVKPVWKTDPVFQTPESVCYDAERNRLYISNINGSPTSMDKNGFISVVSTTGDIISLKWVEGLHAPKGMAIHDGFLYVTDINRIGKIDIANAKIVEYYEAPDAKFLNDITFCNDALYISDMAENTIYKLQDQELSVWLMNEDLMKTNGLCCAKNTIYNGTSIGIMMINPENKEYDVIIPNTGGIDGLKIIDNGKFLISDWIGHVYYLKEGMPRETLLDSADLGINAADFEYVRSTQTLIVPTFSDNRVMAYEIVF